MSEGEYQSLIEKLPVIELKYKLGDVDNVIVDKSNPSETYWEFERTLDEAEKLVQKYRERLLQEQPSWFYKFLAIGAEAKDYFDTVTPGYRLDMYLLAQDLLRELPQRLKEDESRQNSEARKTLKNIIRVIIAGLEYLYSTGDFSTAITRAQDINKLVETKLVTKEDPAYGTRAVIQHFLGRSLRQRGQDEDNQQALDCFYQCSEYYFEMARHRKKKDAGANKKEKEDAEIVKMNNADVIYARTRAMVSLAFGAGFLFYNSQSDLVRAKSQITQARSAFLRDDGGIRCKLHYNYLKLLYASILRAEAGELTVEEAGEDSQRKAERDAAQEKLERALDILEGCEKDFKNKPKYFIHTLYNKALVHLYQGPTHYGHTQACITELIQRCQDNPRWLANGLILKSHLERRLGDVEAALADALRAYNHAGNHLPVRIEALLACGQAQMERGQLIAARNDFEKAIRLNNRANLKLDAMAHLLLTELAIVQQRAQQAREQFSQVKSLIAVIRHGFILNKYRQLEAKIDDLQTDFVIQSEIEDLDYKRYEAELQRWLLEKSLREDSNLTRVAERLNVSKRTVYLWLDKHGIRMSRTQVGL
ncbi:MAG TPA: hypothetical protein VGN95_04535 [Pyrinomonadaceae bacterium]|jgi:hypothetical protein|nr:hypothetical protein [Pyrinomonadaceae bacterium]